MRLHAHMRHPAVPTAQPHQAAPLPPPAAPRQPRFDANLTMRATQAAVGGRAREVCSHVRARLTFASVRSLSMYWSPPASILPLRARSQHIQPRRAGVSLCAHLGPALRTALLAHGCSSQPSRYEIAYRSHGVSVVAVSYLESHEQHAPPRTPGSLRKPGHWCVGQLFSLLSRVCTYLG